MIDSTSPFDRAPRSEAAAGEPNARTAARMTQARDQVSMAQAARVTAALSSQPEVRSEVVARGRELAADPNYPSASILSQVAGTIVDSADPTEDAG